MLVLKIVLFLDRTVILYGSFESNQVLRRVSVAAVEFVNYDVESNQNYIRNLDRQSINRFI